MQHIPIQKKKKKKKNKEKKNKQTFIYDTLIKTLCSKISSIFMAEIHGFFTHLSPGFQAAPLNGLFTD